MPQRDALLDERRMGELLGAGLTGAAADGCERVNAKYRVGDSLRIVYRIAAGGGSHTVAGRTFAGRSASVYRRAAAARVADGPLPAVLHAPELETVFWTFPNDRRLSGLRLLDGRSGALDRLVGRAVARTRLMAYAPERAATAECLDAGGRVLAYVKVHWDAAERELANAEAAAAAIGAGDPHLRLPRVLAASLPDGALVLEPLSGLRLDGLAGAELCAGAARARRRPRDAARRPAAAGAALRPARRRPPRARRRGDRPRPAGLRARAPARCSSACSRATTAAASRSTSTATPTSATRCSTVAGSRSSTSRTRRPARPRPTSASCSPGCSPRGRRTGSAPASRTRSARRCSAATSRPASSPDAAALRWHTAASALARVAVPAVGRVRPAVLARLEPLLRAAGELVA